MIDADALAKRLLEAVADQVGESAVATVRGAEHAEAVMAAILREMIPTPIESHVWNLLALKEPQQVADWINGAVAELRRLRQLERVVLNQLGTTDPRVAAYMIRDLHVARCAPQADESPVCPTCGTWHPSRWNCQKNDDGSVVVCAGDHEKSAGCQWEPWPPVPSAQADGAGEQDVIGLLRTYTATVDGC